MELPYTPTKAGRMELSVTRDLKVVSLLYFHPHLDVFGSNCKMDYGDMENLHFKLLSWKITPDFQFQDKEP